MNPQPETTFTSQCRMIRRHLEYGNTITQREASRLYNCDRLGARIYNLRNGMFGNPRMPIRTEMIQKGRKRFAEYSLKNSK